MSEEMEYKVEWLIGIKLTTVKFRKRGAAKWDNQSLNQSKWKSGQKYTYSILLIHHLYDFNSGHAASFKLVFNFGVQFQTFINEVNSNLE